MLAADQIFQRITQVAERDEVPKASDFKLWAELKGWQTTQTPKGPLKYVQDLRKTTISSRGERPFAPTDGV